MKNEITIAIIDDFSLFLEGFSSLLKWNGYQVIGKYKNGKEFISNIDNDNLPDFVFMSMEMPVMDGFETTLWLQENYPSINVLAMCTSEDGVAVKKMINNGAKGYVFKDIEPKEIKDAIKSVIKKGHFYPVLRDHDYWNIPDPYFLKFIKDHSNQ